MREEKSSIFFLYLILVAVHLTNEFFPADALKRGVGFFSILALIASFPGAVRSYRAIGSLFLLAGGLLYVREPSLQTDFFTYFGSLTNILAFLFVLPILNAVIKLGRYDVSLSRWMNDRTPDLAGYYQKISLTTYLLSIFLFLASYPVVVQSVKQTLKKYREKWVVEILTRSVLRSYAMVMIWSPMEILVGMTLEITRVKYLTLMPVLFGSSCLFLLLNGVLSKRWLADVPFQRTHQEFHATDKKRNIRFLFAVILFVSAVIFFNTFLEKSLLTVITLFIFPFSSLWALSIGKWKKFARYSLWVWKREGANLQSIFFLFLSAGFFTELIRQTNLFAQAAQFLAFVYSELFLFLFFLLLAGFIIALSFLGFHPIVLLTILAPFLQPYIELMPVSMALVLLSGAVCSMMISPYNLSISLLSVLLRESAFRLSRYNWWFAGLFLLFQVAIAVLLAPNVK